MAIHDADSDDAAVVNESYRYHGRLASGLTSFVPAFLPVFLMYLAGYYLFNDPRASWTGDVAFKISWAEIMLVIAALVAISEQYRVSYPGVDNTAEVWMMGGMFV